MPRLLIATTVELSLRSFFLPYGRYFRDLGWTVDAAANGATDDPRIAEAFDAVWEMPWSRNPLAPANFRAAPQRLLRLVEERGYDLVHVHTPVAGFVTRLALGPRRARLGCRLVYTAHGFHFHSHGAPLKNALFRALERLAAPGADVQVVINGEDERAAQRYIDAGRLVRVEGVGVDLTDFAPAGSGEAASLRAELGLEPADEVVLMVAEFIPRKRHRDPVEALAILGRADVHLALAGTGPEMEAVAAMAAERGVADRVHLLGFRHDVPALMRAADVLVLPSEHEGLPTCVIEAQAAGLPVIGSDIRGTRDLLEAGCGVLVPLGDPAALAEAMRAVLDDPDYAAALAARGRGRAAQCDRRAVLAQHRALYERLLHPAAPEPATPEPADA